MEIRQLRYFVGIADAESFSEASKHLFISQSAISQQIKALEEELDTPLFIRNTHSVTLTESGQYLLPLARKVLQNVKECEDCISDIKGLLRGELNIGLTYSLEPYVREAVLSFMKQHPYVQVNVHYKNLPELLQRLRNQEIDMMLSMMPTSPHDFAESTPILQYRLGAVMRKTHFLAKKESLSFEDLKQQCFILPEKGIRDRNAIESYIHAETGTLKIRSLINDANAILNILQESNYVSILAEHIVRNRPSLCFIPIEQLSAPVQVYAHRHCNAPKKRSFDIFLKLLRETPAYYLHDL